MMLPLLLTVLTAFDQDLFAQPSAYSASQIQQNLRKLNTLGTILHIAAHPDDENTQLLAYFANDRHLRTGYLSLTRGEGGQNLIGSEQGDYMGLIRTQELLAARRIDGAEQFFSRAIDFGFTKTADETLNQKWGREKVLSDVVWTIRRFRPDVIFLRFSGTPRDGHGQHQASAILAKEAFDAAADPSRFPEQLKYVQPWRAKRLYFNLFSFNREMEQEAAKTPGRIEIDAGAYNPILGLSYGEIAGLSRSQHESQGMGSPERRGANPNYLALVSGEPASKDPFDGIDTTWARLPNGAAIGTLVDQAIREFRPDAPAKTIPALLKARPLIAAIDHPYAKRKLGELDELLLACSGTWADASAARYAVVPGSQVRVMLSTVNRLASGLRLVEASIDGIASAKATQAPELKLNKPVDLPVELSIPANAPYSQPYWMEQPKQGTMYTVNDQQMIGRPENPPVLTAHFRFSVEGTEFTIHRAVIHRYVDPVRGELTRPFVIVPPVAVEFSSPSIIFPDSQARPVQVTVKASASKADGNVHLETKPGWKVEPSSQPFQLAANEQATLTFKITPPSGDSTVAMTAVAETNGKRYRNSQRVIAYPHIPPQTVFPPALAQLVHADIRITSRNIGYIMGAGDDVPDALRQLGLQVTMLSDDDLASAELSRYDAILTGVRAFNTRPALKANFQRLLDFMNNGGTFVVQYNVLEGFGRTNNDALSKIGPYPITVSRERITVEEAPVNMVDHPVLASPNKIERKDFDGWVQERGLYFAKEFDPRYTSLFSSHDPGEDWLPGGMLYAKYGKGAYVFTAYSWFRQLPAGVPGAYRIFANLLSAK